MFAFPHLFCAVQNIDHKPVLIGMHLPTDVQQIEFLANQGIKVIVSLERTPDNIQKSIEFHHIRHIQIDWPNWSFDVNEKDIKQIAKELATSIIHGGVKVAVHCLGGVGRTGCFISIVMAYILQQTDRSYDMLLRDMYRSGTVADFVTYLRCIGPPDAVDSEKQYSGLTHCLQTILGEGRNDPTPYRSLIPAMGNPVMMMKFQKKYRTDWKCGKSTHDPWWIRLVEAGETTGILSVDVTIDPAESRSCPCLDS